MLNKNMDAAGMPRELAVALVRLADCANRCSKILAENAEKIFESSRGIISIPKSFQTYQDWAKNKPSKHGFDFEARFDFWAESKKGMEGVAFLTSNNKIVFPLYRNGSKVRCVYFPSIVTRWENIEELMPLFPRAVVPHLGAENKKFFHKFQDGIADLCDTREDWLNGKSKGEGTLDVDYKGTLNPAESEAISELDDEVIMSSWATIGKRGMGNSPLTMKRSNESNPWATSNTNLFITKEMLEKALIKEETKLEGTEDMTKAAQVKTGMINVNKEALKQVGYLNAGRASNKLIKEAVRPLLNAMFKPTFMQRIAMKLFKMENPVDVALKSGVSDLLCAQMVQAIIEIKGVENPYVREVTQAGITQAGYELSKAIPFEDAIDQVVAHLEKGAEGIVAKISKK